MTQPRPTVPTPKILVSPQESNPPESPVGPLSHQTTGSQRLVTNLMDLPENAFELIEVISERVTRHLENLAPTSVPSEISVSFGIKCEAKGNIAVISGAATSEFKVDAKWRLHEKTPKDHAS